MSDLCTKMVVQCFTTDEVIRFSINIFGNRVENNKENIFREEGMLSLTQLISVTIQKKVLR